MSHLMTATKKVLFCYCRSGQWRHLVLEVVLYAVNVSWKVYLAATHDTRNVYLNLNNSQNIY